eukprot:m.204677 g.204677  ORF g.204677 m.204677 type:complete len:652 (+) comp26036_c3_seq2:94-2049(+)
MFDTPSHIRLCSANPTPISPATEKVFDVALSPNDSSFLQRLVFFSAFPLMMLWLLLLCTAVAQPDVRNIRTGVTISNVNQYYDQPQVVIMPNGTWICMLTSGPRREGQSSENVYSTLSHDSGQSWSPISPIELPHLYGPPASWVNPVLTPSGRLFAVYSYNLHNISCNKRCDNIGFQVFRYTDDYTETWSDRFIIPIAEMDIDRHNEFQGKHREGWSVGKPIAITETVYMQYTKRKCQSDPCVPGVPYVPMQETVIVSPNMLTEANASALTFWTYPNNSQVGLQTENSTLAEEGNVVPLGDQGDLYFAIRSFDGYVGAATFINGTWTDKLRARYLNQNPNFKDHARFLKNVNGPISPRRFKLSLPCANTQVVYLLLYYNRGFVYPGAHLHDNFGPRNPYWLAAGWANSYSTSVLWSQPEVILYELDITSRIGYPDLFMDSKGVFYATETNKNIPRLHLLNGTLVHDLFCQHQRNFTTTNGRTTHITQPTSKIPTPSFPNLALNQSFTVTFQLLSPAIAESGLSIMDCRDTTSNSKGIHVLWNSNATMTLTISDGNSMLQLTTDEDLLLTPAVHNYVAFVVDGAAKMILCFANGVLCDGAQSAVLGFVFDPSTTMADLMGNTECDVSSLVSDLAVYNRALRTTELVGNWRSG